MPPHRTPLAAAFALAAAAVLIGAVAACAAAPAETDMKPRLYRVILPVADIARATEYYGAVLGMPGERVSPGRHYFDCGGTILACFDPRADGDDFDATANPDHVYFAVADLEAAYTRCRDAGGRRLDDAIATQPWGERCFYAEDPFGNRLCFVDEATLFTGGGAP